MNANTLTQDQLKTLLHYDPDTGVFTWLPRDVTYFKTPKSCKTWNTQFSGKVAGTVDKHGYVILSLYGKKHSAHRIAFLWLNGSFPTNQVDHINHIRADNRWINLRAVTGLENMQNIRLSRKNTSGILGVSWRKDKNKWRSRIKLNGRERALGHFATIEEAAAARAKASVQYGFHPNHGT